MGDDNVLNTPGLMDPSTEFGNMMQTAMKIKGHQMEQDRKKFENWPQFFQNSLWMKGPALELRPLPVSERLPGALKLKEAGNDLFREKKFTDAIEQYEQAVGSFKWAKQHDEDWKKKGIRDETIEVIEDLGEGDTHAAVVELMVSCYNNLAACYLGRARSGSREPGLTVDEDFRLSIHACTAALELQPSCAKALYRRACARVEPISAGATAMDEAIRDLSEAARAAPDDKAVRVMLGKLRKERSAQRQKDTATYSGLFGRGEIYDKKSLAEQAERDRAEKDAVKSTEKARTAEDCEREAQEAEQVVSHLREQGKLDEAAQLEAKIREHRNQLDEYKKSHDEAQRKRHDPRAIDFRNSTAEQLRDAQKHGIDLHDPMVVAELERLQREKDHEDEGGGDAAQRGGTRRLGGGATNAHDAERRAARRRRPPPPDVHGMPLWEIKRRLDDMGVAYSDVANDRPALESRLMQQYREQRSHDRRREEEYYEDTDDCKNAEGWFSTVWSYCTVL